MTPLRGALARAGAVLAAAGIASPEHDARVLALHVLGLARPSELALHDVFADAAQTVAYDGLVARRAARIPLQHLTGSAWFRYLELAVGPGVFVPRPETEAVVQWAIDAVRSERWAAPLLVDLCAGSGTIALALAGEVPGAVVHAVERDPGAMGWLRRNAATRLAVGDPEVMLHLGPVLGALPQLDGAVHLVASNPPYVPDSDAAGLDPEVRDHDPDLALYGGPDGLDVVREVEQTARRLLRPGGLVVVEHSDGQGSSCPQVFRDAGGWTGVADHRDLTGRDRFTTARWTPDPSAPATLEEISVQPLTEADR